MGTISFACACCNSTSTCCTSCASFTPAYFNATLSGYTYNTGTTYDPGFPGPCGWRVTAGSLNGTYQCDYQGAHSCGWRYHSSSFPLTVEMYIRDDYSNPPVWRAITVNDWELVIQKFGTVWRAYAQITSFTVSDPNHVLSGFCGTWQCVSGQFHYPESGSNTAGTTSCTTVPSIPDLITSIDWTLIACCGSISCAAGPSYGC